MAVSVGIDGCRGGWLAVVLRMEDAGVATSEAAPGDPGPRDGSSADVDLAYRLEELWQRHRRASMMLVDMPIGLLEAGAAERVCDRLARRRLGGRGSTVFRVPVRRAVYACDYEEACRINRELTGRRLSRQVWGIAPKIRELDELLLSRPRARRKIRESHPELCFAALAQAGAASAVRPVPLAAKRTEEGYRARLELLDAIFPQTRDVVEAAARGCPADLVGRDDVLDALVLAVAGRLPPTQIPDPAPSDARGLPMAMHYPGPA